MLSIKPKVIIGLQPIFSKKTQQFQAVVGIEGYATSAGVPTTMGNTKNFTAVGTHRRQRLVSKGGKQQGRRTNAMAKSNCLCKRYFSLQWVVFFILTTPGLVTAQRGIKMPI